MTDHVDNGAYGIGEVMCFRSVWTPNMY